MSLFDMLEIDETAGITDAEVEAINNILDRSKIKLAQVARRHSEPATVIDILQAAQPILSYISNADSADEVQQLQGGNVQQQQPAGALGPGQPNTPSPADGGLTQVAVTADEAKVLDWFRRGSDGQARAFYRIFSPDVPDTNRIDVDDNGTPVMATEATAKLTEAQNERKPGSLAHQLAEAKRKNDELQQKLDSASATGNLPADRAEATRQHLELVKQRADELKTSTFTSNIEGLDGLYEAIRKTEQQLTS